MPAIGMIPAILFYLGMVASYPEILDIPVPADHIMQQLDFGWISILFYIVVFGTFIETGTAMIHGINERIDHAFLEHSEHMPRWLRPVVSGGSGPGDRRGAGCGKADAKRRRLPL